MKLLLLTILLLISCSCMRVVTNEQQAIFKQSASDLVTTLEYVKDNTTEDNIRVASSVALNHGRNMIAALEIRLDDLPRARVSKQYWEANPQAAGQDSLTNLNQDENSLATIMSATVIVTMLVGAGLALAQTALRTTPIGQLLGYAGMLFGQKSPVAKKTDAKILLVLEEYKELDPAWRTNKLYVMLSDKMTNAEKDYVKDKRDEVG